MNKNQITQVEFWNLPFINIQHIKAAITDDQAEEIIDRINLARFESKIFSSAATWREYPV